MVATPHALAGAFASRFARTPRNAIYAGVLSHLALDRIPHTDYRLSNRKVLLADLAAATVLTAGLVRRHRLAAAGAFGGVLPDLMMVAEQRTGLRLTLPLHHANHTSIEPPVALGVLTQLITVGLLLARLQRRPWFSRRERSLSTPPAVAHANPPATR
jgi:hypothetical protein